MNSQTSLFDQKSNLKLRLRGKFATKKQIEKNAESKRVDLVMQQNTFLKSENEMYFRMIKAMTSQIRVLNEKIKELSKEKIH